MQVLINVESLKVNLSAFALAVGGRKNVSLSSMADNIEADNITFKRVDILVNCCYEDGVEIEKVFLSIKTDFGGDNYPIRGHMTGEQLAVIKADVLAKLTGI